MKKPVFRFAPSPNGELHLGHGLSALTGFELARRLGGRFLLRIEDIDTARTRPEFINSIFEDLAWLGLEWEEPVLRQSEHFPDYQAAAEKLERLGLLYPCFLTRAELAAFAAANSHARDPDGAPRISRVGSDMSDAERTRRRENGERFALRLDMSRALSLLREKTGREDLFFF